MLKSILQNNAIIEGGGENLERTWIRRGSGSRMSDWQLKTKAPEKYKSTGTKLLEEKNNCCKSPKLAHTLTCIRFYR